MFKIESIPLNAISLEKKAADGLLPDIEDYVTSQIECELLDNGADKLVSCFQDICEKTEGVSPHRVDLTEEEISTLKRGVVEYPKIIDAYSKVCHHLVRNIIDLVLLTPDELERLTEICNRYGIYGFGQNVPTADADPKPCSLGKASSCIKKCYGLSDSRITVKYYGNHIGFPEQRDMSVKDAEQNPGKVFGVLHCGELYYSLVLAKDHGEHKKEKLVQGIFLIA